MTFPFSKMEAHHVIPQQFQKQCAEEGINVHDPRLMAWVEKSVREK